MWTIEFRFHLYRIQINVFNKYSTLSLSIVPALVSLLIVPLPHFLIILPFWRFFSNVDWNDFFFLFFFSQINENNCGGGKMWAISVVKIGWGVEQTWPSGDSEAVWRNSHWRLQELLQVDTQEAAGLGPFCVWKNSLAPAIFCVFLSVS